MSHFKRNRDPKEALLIGEITKAQEIEFLYLATPTLHQDGKKYKELNIMDPINSHLILQDIVDGKLNPEDYVFDIPELPEMNGKKPIKFFHSYTGKYLKYQDSYYKMPNEI